MYDLLLPYQIMKSINAPLKALKSLITQTFKMCNCKLWQYGLWSLQTGGTKLDRFLPKNQHTQRKLLNFENWVSGDVSKNGHHFSKLSDLKNDIIKNCQ